MNSPDGLSAAVEMLPCPFCGQQPALSEYAHDDEISRWVVACDCAGAPEDHPYEERYVSAHANSREQAIAAWNRRLSPVPALVEVEALIGNIEWALANVLGIGANTAAIMKASADALRSQAHRIAECEGERDEARALACDAETSADTWLAEHKMSQSAHADETVARKAAEALAAEEKARRVKLEGERNHWERIAHDRVVSANRLLQRARDAEAKAARLAEAVRRYGDRIGIVNLLTPGPALSSQIGVAIAAAERSGEACAGNPTPDEPPTSAASGQLDTPSPPNSAATRLDGSDAGDGV